VLRIREKDKDGWWLPGEEHSRMQSKNGWWLPSKDTYFSRFVEGNAAPQRKKNGFQREHLEVALSHVKNFGTAIDVGAHVGFWCWDMGNQFKTVYAFEPAPDCYECLVKNVEEQPHVITANVAVGDRDGECELIDDPKRIQKLGVNTGARYVRPSGTGTKMIALDSLRIEACDFLKIDVEGFEYQVLQGARKLIKRYKPVVSMETDKRFSGPRFGIPNTMQHEFMLEHGYVVKERMRPDTVYVHRRG
jgi:FkbM family methyltransferase